MTTLVAQPTPQTVTFARHETFHPRFGWLKKGFSQASANPRIFLEEDAPVQLGVGKNMVRSIRYWCNAFYVLDDDQPTAFGEQLLGDDGWDPYLEDTASLWLLHWNLIQPPCYATAWDFTFNQFRAVEFTYEDLFYGLCECRDRVAPRLADSSIKKDASCILRMYAGQQIKAKASASEDSLDCPFTDLGLIQTTGDSRHYSFAIGPKPTLPPEIVVYAALDFAQQTQTSARTIPLSRLLYDAGSPGQVFKLNEMALCEAIETISDKIKALGLEDAAGRLQLSYGGQEPPRTIGERILASYYDTTQGKG